MRQTSGATFFRSFSETLARAFRWQRTAAAPAFAPETAKPKVAVLSAPRVWLNEFSWDKVLSFNQAQCQLQNTQTTQNPKSYEAVRQLWESRLGQPMSLVKALDFCKECHDQSPFVFSNSSTFCQVAKALVESLVATLPSVEAHIVRTTTAHYVSGKVSKRELIEILRMYESKWAALAQVAGDGQLDSAA